MPSISELVRSSGLVFSGEVVAAGASSVPTVPVDSTLVTVRVTRVLQGDPVLGDLRGRLITVKSPTAQQLIPGQSALFFTRSWIHAANIAVQEIARVDTTAEPQAVAAVRALPNAHLLERLTVAERVAVGEVTAVSPLPNQPLGRRSPQWAVASVRIDVPVKGDKKPATILFPTSTSIEWYRSPRFQRGQRGVFVMHRNDPRAVRWIDQIAVGGAVLSVLDPADVQPEAEAARIQGLLASAGGQP